MVTSTGDHHGNAQPQGLLRAKRPGYPWNWTWAAGEPPWSESCRTDGSLRPPPEPRCNAQQHGGRKSPSERHRMCMCRERRCLSSTWEEVEVRKGRGVRLQQRGQLDADSLRHVGEREETELGEEKKTISCALYKKSCSNGMWRAPPVLSTVIEQKCKNKPTVFVLLER